MQAAGGRTLVTRTPEAFSDRHQIYSPAAKCWRAAGEKKNKFLFIGALLKQTLPSPEQRYSARDDSRRIAAYLSWIFAKMSFEPLLLRPDPRQPTGAAHGVLRFICSAKAIFPPALSPEFYFSALRPLCGSSPDLQGEGLPNRDFCPLRNCTAPRLESAWFSTGITGTPYSGEGGSGGVFPISTGWCMVFQQPQQLAITCGRKL